MAPKEKSAEDKKKKVASADKADKKEKKPKDKDGDKKKVSSKDKPPKDGAASKSSKSKGEITCIASPRLDAPRRRTAQLHLRPRTGALAVGRARGAAAPHAVSRMRNMQTCLWLYMFCYSSLVWRASIVHRDALCRTP